MEDPKERLSKSVSDAELERRWGAVRAGMRKRGIDYLVMQNSEEFMGGMLRWFTDYTARHQFPMTVIFPVDDEMTVINCGAAPPVPQVFPPAWFARGIKNRLGDVYFSTMPYTAYYDARLAVDVLKDKPTATIAWVEPTFIPMTFADYLREKLPGATFVDATEWVDAIKVPKSAEEIELIKGTCALQDACIDYLKGVIRPGLHDYEVYAEAHYYLSKNGSERGLVQVNSGPLGTMVPFDVPRFQNRVIQKGDQVSVLIEVNGPGGYYAEVMRIFTVGAGPTPELQAAFSTAVETQRLMASLMKPGAEPKAIWDKAVASMTAAGYLAPARSISHGQGTPLVERPNIRPDETWTLKEGMNLAVHPSVVKPPTWSIVCDNFIIGKDGAEKIHRYPQEIIVV
ncbi:MAG: M24 family metallopeptidase [bacterium]